MVLQSFLDLGRLTYRRFLELFRQMVGLLGRVISPSQGLYLHTTTQHRKTRTNTHALSGIRTYDPSNQPAKTHASDSTATVTGIYHLLHSYISTSEGRELYEAPFMEMVGSRADPRRFVPVNTAGSDKSL
jgi:hypothetical protein